jgi:enoyl-CoA hydratase/carnithine racemase
MLEILDHGAIREIRLNRPPANAINPDLAAALDRELHEAADAAAAVVVSGLPGMFSAGLDVPELLKLGQADMATFWRRFQGLLRTLAEFPVPVVFALTGHAPAGGIVMAIFGDYRIMPAGAFKTGLNEAQVGLVAPPIAHGALTRLVGVRVAERILVAGEMMDSQRAFEIGLVDELADDPQATVEAALDWCRRHLELPRESMLATRTMCRADLRALFADSDQWEAEAFVGHWFEPSTQETLKRLAQRLGK